MLAIFYLSHQAGSYEDATELARKAYDIEEKELGNRIERMVDLSSLMCYCIDGVREQTCTLHTIYVT